MNSKKKKEDKSYVSIVDMQELHELAIFLNHSLLLTRESRTPNAHMFATQIIAYMYTPKFAMWFAKTKNIKFDFALCYG